MQTVDLDEAQVVLTTVLGFFDPGAKGTAHDWMIENGWQNLLKQVCPSHRHRLTLTRSHGFVRSFFVIWKLRRRQRDRENSRRWWGIWNFTQSWGWAADQLRIGFEKYLYLEFAKSFLFFVDTCLNVSFGGVVDFSNYCRVNPLHWPFQGIDNI